MAIRILDFANSVESDRQRLIQHCLDNNVEVEEDDSLSTVVTKDLLINVPSVAGTATEEDVISGKTFYNGQGGVFTLKTGTNANDPNISKLMFMYTPETAENTEETRISFQLPSDRTLVRSYLFMDNSNYVDFYFNNNLTSIESYAFRKCHNFTLHNFENLSALTTIGDTAFYESGEGIDLSQLPTALKSMGSYCFYNYVKNGDSIILPATMTSIGTYCFAAYNGRKACNQFLLPLTARVQTLSNYALYYLSFDNDFVTPSYTTTIGNNFNRGGSFNNVHITSNITKLGSSCFGGYDTDPISDYHLDTVTFEKTTPPTIDSNIFANQHKTNNFKIYVPDESVNAYKAVTNLAQYADYIYPVSEKPVDPAKTEFGSDYVTVTLDANQGVSPVSSVVEQYGTNWHDLPTPTRDGFTFDGWYTTQGHKSENGMKCCNIEPFTLTAHWTANT